MFQGAGPGTGRGDPHRPPPWRRHPEHQGHNLTQPRIGNPQYLRGILLAAAGALCLVPDAALVRLAHASDAEIVFWRAAMLATALSLVVAFRYRERSFAAARSLGPTGFLIGAAWGTGMVLFVYAVNHTAVANALVILSTAPLFAALFSSIILGERLLRRTWITMAIVFTGVAVTFGSAIRIDGLDGAPAAVAVAAALGMNLTLARRHEGVDIVPALALGGVLAALVTLPIAWAPAISPRDVLVIGAMGFVLVPTAFVLLSLGTRYIPSPEVSMLMLLETVFGPLFAWMVTAEAPPPLAVVGGAIIIGALASNSWLAIRDRA